MVKKRKDSWVLWSKEELRLLKRLFPLGRARQVVQKTGRPLSAVRQKAYSIGLRTRQCRRWSASEIEIVKRLYPTKTARSIADRLGRSKDTVIAKAHSIGVRKAESYGPPRWSKQEDSLLKKLYRDQDNTRANIAKQIGRSISAIAARAQALGLRRRNPPWSKEELNLLRKLYPTRTAEQIADQIGRPLQATMTRIFKLGLKKRKRKT